MPIYEYKCQSCGRVSELLAHSFNDSKDQYARTAAAIAWTDCYLSPDC